MIYNRVSGEYKSPAFTTLKTDYHSLYTPPSPQGYFVTKIFHPNVQPSNGDICVNVLKKDWKPDLGLKHLLLVIRCLLIEPNPDSALNEEAGKLLLEEYEEFFRRAKLMTQIHAKVSTAGNENAAPGTNKGGNSTPTSPTKIKASAPAKKAAVQKKKAAKRL